MRRRHHFAVAALAVVAPLAGATALHGCSSDPDFESVCLWVADPNNCFRKFLIDQESVQDTCKPLGTPTQVNLAKGDNGVSNGAFIARDKTDVCFISGGGTVTFDPPLDLTKFPAPLLDTPTTYKMVFTGFTGTECGNATYVSPHGFSLTINDPTGGTGAGGASGAGGSAVTIVDGGDGGPGTPYGTYTQVIPAGGDAFTATCPNGESHRFNLYEVEGQRLTDDGGYRSNCPSVDGLVPKAAFVVNPGGVNAPGAVSFAIYWPPVAGDASYPNNIDATLDPLGAPIDPQPIVYFNCSIGAAPPPCADGAKNGSETDVDCGGTEISPECPTRCGDGQLCISDCDCGGGLACIVKSGTRVCGTGTPTITDCTSVFVCSNGRQDGDETGTDCGGSCPNKCADGAPCKVNGDCANGYCNAGLCAVASCSDMVKNGTESDVDCGGSCAKKCDNGQTCAQNADCSSLGCLSGVCRVPTCTDMAKDGAETDVDCGGGGACPTCDDGKVCLADGDCMSGICGPAVIGGAIKHCFPTTCAGDGGSHQCGGTNCELCANGITCTSNADCISNGCVANLCATPTCSDSVQDGNETDTDCGGPICQRCPSTKHCSTNSDCVSGNCFNGLCQ